MEKKLFGGLSPYPELKARSVLFLYHVKKRSIKGPFIATTEVGMYDGKAWKGKFKKQVKFE